MPVRTLPNTQNHVVLLVVSLVCLICEVNFADDWPQWRGPQRDNVSKEIGLLKKWPSAGPKPCLRIEGFGAGIAAPAVVGDRAYTLGVYGGYEYVIAFSTETGERLWLTKLGVPSSDDFVSAHRIMRWLSQRTPTVHDGKVYAVSTYGTLVCMSTEDGQPLWSKDFRKEYGVERQKWGYCDYPLVDGDVLICVPGGALATVVALNRHTGAEVWRRRLTTTEKESYPIVRSVHSATLRGKINETDFYVVATDDAIRLLRCIYIRRRAQCWRAMPRTTGCNCAIPR
jgi:outer membrane protein assembly factor BamB